MKVLIVQLFPRQFQKIAEAYKGTHELDYMDSTADESNAKLRTKAEAADKVVVLTKFMSHKHSDVIPREKIVHADSVNVNRMLSVLDTIPPDSVTTSKPKRVARLIKPGSTPNQEQVMSSSTTRTVDGFVLTTAVPPPTKSNKPGPVLAWPVAAMKIGESFFVEEDKPGERRKLASKIAAAYNYLRKKYPERHFQTALSTTKSPYGVRCWRLNDFTPEELAEKKKIADKRQATHAKKAKR